MHPVGGIWLLTQMYVLLGWIFINHSIDLLNATSSRSLHTSFLSIQHYIQQRSLFYFFVPFCFHASLVFCTHTHTHFLLTTRYLTVTEGKFHLIPFHIIRHLLGSHCHVMTISEDREQTLFCSLLWFGSLIFCMCVCTIWIDRYSYLYFEVFRNTKFSKYYSIAMLLLILATTFGTFTLKIL